MISPVSEVVSPESSRLTDRHYKVVQTNQPNGIMWAVCIGNMYKFVVKDKGVAQRYSDRLNRYRERRENELS